MNIKKLLFLALVAAGCSGDESNSSSMDDCPLSDNATVSGMLTAGTVSLPPLPSVGISSDSLQVEGNPSNLEVYIAKPDANAPNGGLMPGQLAIGALEQGDCKAAACVSLSVETSPPGPGVPGTGIRLDSESGTLTLDQVDLTPGTGRLAGSLTNVLVSITLDGGYQCKATMSSVTFDLPVAESSM